MMENGSLKNEPLILAIETATNCGSVALVSGTTFLAEDTVNSSTTHSRRITGQIDIIMKECGCDFADLSAIAVSIGPGSFTGLRIGLSAAKGISLAYETPVIGVSTLDALACQIADRPSKLVCSVLDARKKEVYCRLYKCDERSRPVPECDHRVVKPGELAAMISEPTHFIGNGCDVYGEQLEKELGGNYIPSSPLIFLPRGAAIALLAVDRFQAQDLDNPATLVPCYIRQSEAEVARAKKLAKQNP